MKIDTSFYNNHTKTSTNTYNQHTTSIRQLSFQEKQQLLELQTRDIEVRAHEAAHKNAGGSLAGNTSYQYQKGPDGKMYAIGGEVSISLKEGNNPQETIENAQQIKTAALAPANPSPQDYRVASSATIMQIKAQQQLHQEEQKKQLGLQKYKKYSID